ncbi:Homeobox-leucine zipper protein HOX19 [Apostasia shenzhenica]|uniref:Homeobox-leucine zipper protein HOX19 n=1 Tax=Apostasia shenzhenica TaxID=1088818 RepID=A0A2I0A2B9_9ASPA|nr:Homeobox-leucine zipper protein HOX19 [Apostasia shenzhenica]
MEEEEGYDTALSLGKGYAGNSVFSLHGDLRRRPLKAPTSTAEPLSLTLSLSDEFFCSRTDNPTNKVSASSARVSSSHSTVSSFSTANVKKERRAGGPSDEAEVERGYSRGSDEDEEELTGARKKLRLTKEQSALLEDMFKEQSTLNTKQKQALAKHLNLRPRQVEVWFQNRRARTKLKQMEVNSEFLKRCCETLKEENRRLHRELQELKALKSCSSAPPLPPPQAPPFFLQLPPATLKMCPSCQRVMSGAGGKVVVAGGVAYTASSAPPPPHFLNPLSRSAAC